MLPLLCMLVMLLYVLLSGFPPIGEYDDMVGKDLDGEANDGIARRGWLLSPPLTSCDVTDDIMEAVVGVDGLLFAAGLGDSTKE